MSAAVTKRQFLIAFIVIIAAGLVTWLMISNREQPSKKAPEQTSHSVTVVAAQPQTLRIPLATQGVVEPRTRIRLLPEVNGKIISAAPAWVNGGFFHKGDVMLRIEDHAYQNQLSKARATLAQAQSTLTQEKALAYVAEKEWQQRDNKPENEASRDLALRKPQLEAARQQVASARADVASAEIALAKTRIRAPFDGIVSNKATDIGQVVSPGQLLAEFSAIDWVEVRVPLTERQRALLQLPGLTDSSPIEAHVNYITADTRHSFTGQLVRTEAMLDEVTKVLYGVIRIADPYGLSEDRPAELPIGAFVEVDVISRELNGVITIAQRLLRSGNRVWVADSDNRLQQRTVELLPVRGETVYVAGGLKTDDRIITSSIVDAHEGTVVDVIMDDKAEP